MDEAFLGEIRMFGGTYAPENWQLCYGQLVPISQNQALYAILGNNYGGDGRTNFGLPDFRGIFPIGQGQNPASKYPYILGRRGGSEVHRLQENNLPPHSHTLMATTEPGNLNDPTDALLGNTGSFDKEYVQTRDNLVQMSPLAIGDSGNGDEFYAMPPFSVVNFIICMNGLFPPRP